MSFSVNPICVWDFTLKAEGIEFTEVRTWLKEVAKKWSFQLEEGEEGGYKHYQGRCSLKLKARKLSSPWKILWYTPTSKENSENDFYAVKADTRIAGPWKDSDEEVYIPRQIREIAKLYPWQQYIADHYDVWDTRTVNILYDPEGGKGKSVIKGYMRAHKLGRPLPFANDYKDIMRMVMDMPTSKCYLIDIPRAINKDKLFQLYAGIESIKDGYAYDDRYSFKEKYFDCPNIWVFTNTLPEFNLLSNDRWKVWQIKNRDLIPYIAVSDQMEEMLNMQANF